jgi:GT2 family glycosyltransferase
MSQINPNNSRFGKLKKLFHISTELIHEYGITYFLRIFVEELFKQKGKLFSPDTISNEIKNEFIVNYDDYLKNLILEKRSYQLKIQNFSSKPLFALMLFINKKNPPLKNLLKDQVYENFELILVSSTKKYIDFFVSKNNISNFQKLILDKPKMDDILSISKADYFIFLNNHSILQHDFLFNIAHQVNQNFIGDVYYFDEDFIDKNQKRNNPFFKPDFSPYLLRSFNYVGHSFVATKNILKKLSDFKLKNENFHYDLILHCAELSDNFVHIPIPCCSILKIQKTDHSKIISQHIQHLGINALVENNNSSNTYRVHYVLKNEPKVSIIIPTKNNKSFLKRCIESLKNNTNYKNFEIIIIDNNSNDAETLEYYDSLDYSILSYTDPFNFSKMNNLGIKNAKGDYFLCLNDDTKSIDPDWLTEMVSICQQNDVGIVGAKLLHSNVTIQHAGAVFLKSGSGFHVFENILENDLGFFNLHNVIRDFSAVTGACLLIKKSLYHKIDGYDDNFDLFYGDADLCLKTIKAGFHVVYTPFARLLHEGSTTIKKNSESFFAIENHFYFIKKWPHLKQGDPFYNTNLGWNYTIAKST